MMPANAQPKILMIGGPDVDTRIELIRLLRGQYQVRVAGSNPELAGRFAKEDILYHYYSLGRKFNPFSYLISFTALYSIIRQERPDAVHTFDTIPSILGRLAAKLNRTPVIIGTITGLGSLYIVHEKSFLRWLRPAYELFQKILCRLSDLTIFYTQDDADFFLSRGLIERHKLAVVSGSGISLERFSPERFSEEDNARTKTEFGIVDGQLVVTLVARLVRSKGVLLFAELARKIRLHFPDVQFLLIGPHDTDSLDSLTASELQQVCAMVKWLGNQPQVEKFLAISNIFILPSGREGIPRSLMEAAAMNLPLIATDLSGCREVIVNGKNGFLIPQNDLNAFEQALVELIAHPELRSQFGAASRKLVVENFDLIKTANTFSVIYHDLLLQKGVI